MTSYTFHVSLGLRFHVDTVYVYLLICYSFVYLCKLQTQMALHQHTSAALAQMHRDRSLVEYLQQNASVRNNAKTSDYTSQLLRQVERYEEVSVQSTSKRQELQTAIVILVASYFFRIFQKSLTKIRFFQFSKFPGKACY